MAMAIVDVVQRMETAGYRLELDGGKLVVSGSKPLSAEQQGWLRRNKAALLDYLHVAPETVPPQPTVLPPPATVLPVSVRCLDCHHSDALPGDELGAWRLCHAGRGGWFGLQRHRCDRYAPCQRPSDVASRGQG